MSFIRRLVERSRQKALERRPAQRTEEGQRSVPGIHTDVEGDAATVTVDKRNRR